MTRQMQTVPRIKRIFYAVVGSLCVFMSVGVLSKILRDLFWGVDLAYGKVGLMIEHPMVQGAHLIIAFILWTLVFLMGSQWLLRAKTGREAVTLAQD